MKVLILAQYFPPDLGGGPTRAYNVAKGLKLNGCQVVVVTAFPHYPDGDIPKEYHWRPLKTEVFDGIRLIRTFVPSLPSRGMVRRTLMFFSFMISALLAYPFVRKADAVWAANPNILSFFPAYLYSKVMECPLVLNVDDLWPEELDNVGLTDKHSIMFRFGQVLASFAYSHADMITPVSPGYTQTIAEKYHTDENKIIVVRAGVDLGLFKPTDEKKKDDGTFRILYSGAFSIAYDFDQVLLAANLAEDSEGIEFVLQGKGELIGQVKSRVRELNLSNVTIMDVKLTRKEVSQLLNNADALILPLRGFKTPYTGISSKIYEYQAVGKPIICCAEGQPADYVSQTSSGIIVKPGDSKALLQTVHYLEAHPAIARSMGDSGRSFVESNMSIARIGLRLKQSLERIPKGRMTNLRQSA